MKPTRLSRRRRKHRYPLRDRGMFPGLDPGGHERARACARSSWATIPTRSPASSRTVFRRPVLIGGDREFEELVAKVVGFVEAPALGLDLPLDVRGTAFQQRVWQALRKIPAGSTASYAEIAKRIGAPKSVRAVARACAANAIAVAIPCHRVVRNDGASLWLPLGRRAQARPARRGRPRHERPAQNRPAARPPQLRPSASRSSTGARWPTSSALTARPCWRSC